MSDHKRPNVRTIEDIEDRIEEIRRLALEERDNEAAHVEEDDLHAEVLLLIANQAQISGGKWAQEMASAARRSYRVEFERWYA